MIEFVVYIVIVVFVVILSYFKWNNRRFEKLAAKLPGPLSFPIIGLGYKFLGSPEQTMNQIFDLMQEYNPGPIKVWIGPYFGVAIAKPEDVQIVLNSSKALHKGRMYDFFKNTLGDGLFTAPGKFYKKYKSNALVQNINKIILSGYKEIFYDGILQFKTIIVDKWRRHRRMITPAFNAKLLEQFFPVFNEKNKILIRNVTKELNKTQAFDLWDYIEPFALESICQTAVGYNIDTQSNKKECEFSKAIKTGMELNGIRVSKPWLYPEFMFSMYLKLIGQQRIFEKVQKFPSQVIKEKKDEFDQRKKAINDKKDVINNDDENQSKLFLDLLFKLNDDGENYSDVDIRHEVVTMMYAGSDTSATVTCFCLLMLAIHQDIQDKVYDEIYNVLGESDQTITIEDITKLVYLDQVLKETLRLYPVATLMFREIQEDLKIFSSDYVLPKGTICVICPVATHLSPDLYPNPRSFNPENFSPENVDKRHKYSFIPFSGGPRGCIGSKYATLSMKVTLSTFLRNFSVHSDMKLTDIKLEIGIMMKSVHGYPVKIQPRDRRPTYKRNQNGQ